MKYHVNPDTGQVGQCRAQLHCRFGGDHFATAEEARASFEAHMGGVVRVSNHNAVEARLAYEEASASFVASLTEEERSAISAYANQDYDSINGALWRGEHHGLTDLIDCALAKAPRIRKTIVRKPFMGADTEEVRANLSKFKPSAHLHLRGYSSFSENINAMFPLLHVSPRPSIFGVGESRESENVLLRLDTDRAAPISALSHMRQEHEWLLPRDAKILVQSVKTLTLETDTSILGEALHRVEQRRVMLVECVLET